MFSLKTFQMMCILLVLNIGESVNAAATKKQDPKCLLPMEPGPCRLRLDRFYYNAKTDSCEEFKFGGCKGNDNKFGFKQTCEEACKMSTAVPSTTEKVQLINKQLNASTLKSLTSTSPVTEKNEKSATTTTVKPQVAVKKVK